jgi:hypothetical protein
MGRVGVVFAFEVSRTGTLESRWHRLLDLSALTETLVIHEVGCYAAADFNDGLVLGFKGAKLGPSGAPFLTARLQGAKLNKAKVNYASSFPVGFCYDQQGHTIKDPDEEVRGAVDFEFVSFVKRAAPLE